MIQVKPKTRLVSENEVVVEKIVQVPVETEVVEMEKIVESTR